MKNQSSNFEANWYILYTSPRAEKTVQNELLQLGYEIFLPIIKEFKVWKNRQKKWIDRIMFPSYVFVKTQHHELYKIKQVPKVMTYLHIAGKPCIVPIKIIEGVKKIMGSEKNISVEPNFNKGERVKILDGPLAGYSGILIRQKGKTRFGIQLREINHTVFVDISNNNLEKIAV